MKKITLSSIVLLLSIGVFAQDLMDGFRLSRTDLNGTARFVSMSGAFGALGGDLSSLQINPAGSAVFLSNQGAMTLDLGYNRNKTQFGSLQTGEDSSRRTSFDLPQAGAVFVFKNNDANATVTKLTFGLNYQRTLNHDARFSAFGRTNESIGSYFVNQANGIQESNFIPGASESLTNRYIQLGRNQGFRAQEAYLAYESFLLNSTGNGMWESNAIAGSNGFVNDLITRESGFNGQVMFNMGLEIKEKLYLGMNLNTHLVNYSRFSSYFESNNGPGEIQEIEYNNDLRTTGAGFSMQFGAIYKPINSVRLGLAYHSPTWFRMEDELVQDMFTFSEEFGEAFVNPGVINFFPRYSFQTPAKTTLSAAYIFGQNGLISVDYTIEDYTNQRFRSSGFSDLNNMINNSFQTASSLNIGVEYRIGLTSLRGGYHYAQSPFTDGVTFGDTNGFSLGLGYSFGNTTLDFAYRRTTINRQDQFVQTGISERAFVDNTLTNFFLTLSFGL